MSFDAVFDALWGRCRSLPRREPACCIDAAAMAGSGMPPRTPVAGFFDDARAFPHGLVLLLDHAQAASRDALKEMQARQPARFAAGAVVVGVENVGDPGDASLAPYRALTRAPVFAVDLSRAGDRALLTEALMVSRVVASLAGGTSRAASASGGRRAAAGASQKSWVGDDSMV